MENKILKSGLIGGLLTGLLFIGGCVPEGTEGGTTSIWTMVIFVVLLFGLMYFVMIRPQRRRQKEHEQLMQELQKGDNVMTAGGIYGRIESVSDDSVVIKVESGATLRVARSSVVVRQEK